MLQGIFKYRKSGRWPSPAQNQDDHIPYVAAGVCSDLKDRLGIL